MLGGIIEYIQENEQIIAQTQVKGDWTIELKSAICDGKTAYVIFSVTAPEDVNLEEANVNTPGDMDDIVPGNAPGMVMDPKSSKDFGMAMTIYSGVIGLSALIIPMLMIM